MTSPGGHRAIDLSTDYPKIQGLNHVMIMVDVASNFVCLKALKGKTSKELASALRNMMAHYGVPMRVRHDQERGLMGGEFKDLCNELSIIQETGLPNKPQTNGKVKAQVKNLKYALKCLTSAEGSSVSRATMETPEFLMFGHSSENTCYDLVSRKEVTFVGIDERSHFIRTEYHEHQKRLLEVRNQNRRSNGYEEGDLVMQPSVPGVRHAQEPRYRGPYVITDLTGSSAEIKGLMQSFPKTVRVHIDQLKPAVAAKTLPLDQTMQGTPGENDDGSSVDDESATGMDEGRTKVGMDASFEDQMAEIQQETAPMEKEVEMSAKGSDMKVILMPEAEEARKKWMTKDEEKIDGLISITDEEVGSETASESPDGADVFLPTDSSEDESMDRDLPNPYEGMGVWTHSSDSVEPQLEGSSPPQGADELDETAKESEGQERREERLSGEKRGIQDEDQRSTGEYGLWVTPSPLPPKIPRVEEARTVEEDTPGAARVVPRVPDGDKKPEPSAKRSRSPGSEVKSRAKKRPMNEGDEQMQT